jgi:hypothetical protein
MRETSAWAWSLDRLWGAVYGMSRKQRRGRPRLHWLVLLLLGSVSLAQSRSEPALTGHQQRSLQEQWFLRGRSSFGEPGAARRYRAYLQKMRMRAARLARAQKSGDDAFPSSSVVWSPLGPAPLASDASGVGEYDYGWVSGRATAVAIDPADPTGNTVYIGGVHMAEF